MSSFEILRLRSASPRSAQDDGVAASPRFDARDDGVEAKIRAAVEAVRNA